MRTSPSRSTIVDRRLGLAGALACLACFACKSLADTKEGPSRPEIEAAKARVEHVRGIVIESQLQSDDDEEKEFWLSILERLGDFRAELSRKPAR